MTDDVRMTRREAEDLMVAVLIQAGVSQAVSASVAAALVAAQAEGQVGHGFSRLGDYVAQVKSGKINKDARIEVTRRGPASLLVDADRGFAYPALDAALKAGIPLAHEMGIAVLAVGNSHHCGALSVQVERLAKAGLIGLMVANTPKAIAPWGASEPVFGTNPIAFATPRGDGEPLVIDLSLSKVARGKVMAARKAGTDIPPGWALDRDGNPTTDPGAALEGTMLPIGDAKGTALALVVELLAAAFTGSAFSKDAGSFFTADGAAPRVGQTLIAIRPEPSAAYLTQVSELLDGITALEGVRLPGDRRRAAIAASDADGLLVPAPLVALARELAGEA